MMKVYLEEIYAGKDVRKNLISLRQELKTEEKRRAFAYLLCGDFQMFLDLLKNEDPKVRKNAALILGDMETEEVLPFLFSAYQKENTLFVRSDYLRAMQKLDYRFYVEKLKKRLETLQSIELKEENRKHVREETAQLQSMILKYEKPKKHIFIGYEPAPEVILVTNRHQTAAVREQVTTGKVTQLAQGLRIKNGNLRELVNIRLYTELLFLVPDSRPISGTPWEIGESLAKMGLADFLERLHKKGGCFYYRMEVKGGMPLEKKGVFIRRVSEALDALCNGRMRNNAAEYEVELRLLQRKDGSFTPMIRLFTLPDHRFDYRKEVIASSISPVNAALTVWLARNYLKENAQILDPFCGVGTMLLERNKLVPADPMYGVDLFGEAIEKARENTKRDGSIVHYINRDFFDFTHGHLFDELITDMPRNEGVKGSADTEMLYQKFFERAPEFLKDEAVMVLYTMEPDLVRKIISGCGEYEKLEEFLINEKRPTFVFVLRIRK